jgi:hypothetical protein
MFYFEKKANPYGLKLFLELSHFLPKFTGFAQKFSSKIFTKLSNGIYFYTPFFLLNSNQFTELGFLS